MPNAAIPVIEGDQNRLNLRNLANLVAKKVFKKDISSIVSDEKQLIIDELNEAQRIIAIKSDTWKWLYKSVSIQSFDHTTATPVTNVNFPTANINDTFILASNGSFADNVFYVAQPFVYGDSTSALTAITITVNNPNPLSWIPTGALQVQIVSDNAGVPNMTQVLLTSTPQTVAGILNNITSNNATFPLIGNTLEAQAGTKYWVVIIGVNINNTPGEPITGLSGFSTGLTLPAQIPYFVYTSADGLSWSIMGGGNGAFNLWFQYTLNPRNYNYILIGPSDCGTPQVLRVPTTGINPSVYVLRLMPYDYVQNSVFANYRLGTEFFTVVGYENGCPKFEVPLSIKATEWLLEYKAKIQIMVEDKDEPQLPSEYRTLLVLMATLSLISLGYGTQTTDYIALLTAQINDLKVGLMRDYNNAGEQYVNIIGQMYYPGQAARVKQTNEKYSGPMRLGVFPPAG